MTTTNNETTRRAAEETVQALLRELAELLVQRDQYNKEAGSNMTGYIQEFGELLIKNFELKISCIEKKKAISYCRRRINRGLPVELKRMKEELEAEMKHYYMQLKEMTDEAEAARTAETIEGWRITLAKKIYRRLAKLLHPDINKRTETDETLKDLWRRIVLAYNASNVEELEDLEVLVRNALEELGETPVETDTKKLETRIERVERQISEIITTEPYTYGEMLRDEEKKQEYRNRLQEEHDDMETYLAELQATLEDIVQGGELTIVWNPDLR